VQITAILPVWETRSSLLSFFASCNGESEPEVSRSHEVCAQEVRPHARRDTHTVSVFKSLTDIVCLVHARVQKHAMILCFVNQE